jgi:hypothetical protein
MKTTELINQEIKTSGRGTFLLNTKQAGEALELLSDLESNSVSLVFFDPQYEPVRNVLSAKLPALLSIRLSDIKDFGASGKNAKTFCFLSFMSK